MASISNANGYRTIQFIAPDGKRKSIRWGKCNLKSATAIKAKVEALIATAMARVSLDDETAAWVKDIPDRLADKLAKAGLIPARKLLAMTLGQFLDFYIAGRKDVKEGTRANFGTDQARLLEFFGADKDLRAITEGDAEDWKIFLFGKEYARATVGKAIKNARQFFRSALRRGLVKANPFDAIKAPGMKNEVRSFNVTREMAQQVLDACPDGEWRLIFALSRFGGLRCPSEHLGLKWVDVDWERNRFRVHAPKTEHHQDGGDRWVPIFPELRPHLEEAFDRAEEGAVHVVTKQRESNKNLRTQLCRIIRKAGLTPWPRLFQNLRASRETELAQAHPLHVVCKWIGNSPRVAADHYLQVTEDHFDLAGKSAANSGAVNDEKALQKPVQQPAASVRNEPQTTKKAQENRALLRELATTCDCLPMCGVTPTGFEPVSRP